MSALNEEEQRRIEAFLQLSRIERGTRGFIKSELAKIDGPDWHRRLPQDVREKVEARGLEFTDFPDLRKILNSSWKRLGDAVRPVKRAHFLNLLEALEPIRNDVAHSRDISEGALSVIQAAYYLGQPILGLKGQETSFPASSPSVIAQRLRVALTYTSEINPADIAALQQDPDHWTRCEALEAYERIRQRPGRGEDLMQKVRSAALTAVDEIQDSNN